MLPRQIAAEGGWKVVRRSNLDLDGHARRERRRAAARFDRRTGGTVLARRRRLRRWLARSRGWPQYSRAGLVLEPPVFGASMENFHEMAEQFLAGARRNSGFQRSRLGKVWVQLIEDNAIRERMGTAAREISERNRGATERSLERITAVLNRLPRAERHEPSSDSLLWPLTLPYGAVSHLRARAYRSGILQAAPSRRRRDQRRQSHHRRHRKNAYGALDRRAPGGAKAKASESSRAAIAAKRSSHRQAKCPAANRTLPFPPATKCTCCKRGSEIASPSAWVQIASRAARELAKRGVNWFVLDDGFQHLQLARDVDIVLIDATNPFGGGHLLPAGRLREPRSALARADIIVITRSTHAPAVEAAVRRDSDAPIFYARPNSIPFTASPRPARRPVTKRYRTSSHSAASATPPRSSPICAVGDFKLSATSFFRIIIATRSRRPAKFAEARAGAGGLICTEKDRFNLPDPLRKIAGCSGSARYRCASNVNDFWRTVMSAIESRRKSPVNHSNLRARPIAAPACCDTFRLGASRV